MEPRREEEGGMGVVDSGTDMSSAVVRGEKEGDGSFQGLATFEDEGLSFSDDTDESKRDHLLKIFHFRGSKRIECKAPVGAGAGDPIQIPEEEELQLSSDFDVIHPSRSRYASCRKRLLLEVFAVLFIEYLEPPDIQAIEDDLVIVEGSRKYVLWKKSGGQVNSEGHLILTGPNCSVVIPNFFAVGPCYLPDYDLTAPKIMWQDTPLPTTYLLDSFQSNYVGTKMGIMEVRFAVYGDGMEIQLEISLSDLDSVLLPKGRPFQVYGTVKASNSIVTHSEAKSVLFDHITSQESATLGQPDEGRDIHLPLSRSVIAVPRDSNLVVDVCLYVCGGISIAYGSVSFCARTRCNSFTEEMILRGRNANVKVKATWVDAEENDGGEMKENEGARPETDNKEGVEEEDGKGEPEDDAEGSCQMESGNESYDEDIPDDMGSLRSSKVPRLNWHEDVSSRASECSLMEAPKCEHEEVSASSTNRQPHRFESSLLELFSVKFVEFENLNASEIYGFVLLEAGTKYQLFRRVRGDPLPIDSKGFFKLEGPKFHAIRADGDLEIDTFLFKYEGFEFEDEGIPHQVLWKDDCDRFQSIDKLESKMVQSQFGPLEVNYAVYGDGVEAHVKVMLTDCSFSSVEVYGDIIATHSEISDRRASSTLFNRKQDEAVHAVVRPGEETVLPLSRSIIALPYKSNLKLEVILSSKNKPILSASFKFDSLKKGLNRKSHAGNDCSVVVVVDYDKDVSYI